MGHESHTAHDGQATIATADAVRPDVVILDIRMPQVDGYAAARTLRQRPWARGLVLYALTGWGEARDRERTREAGFDCHFVKPVSIDELLSQLADDLQRPRTYERDPSDAEAEPGD
jgi:CheY-like chemotaxis protein